MTASGPVGRATAQEWNDIAEGLRERVSKLESIVQQHTHSLAQAPNVHPSTIKKIEELSASVEKRFAEGGERVTQRMNSIEREFNNQLDQIRDMVRNLIKLPMPRPESRPTIMPRLTVAITRRIIHDLTMMECDLLMMITMSCNVTTIIHAMIDLILIII